MIEMAFISLFDIDVIWAAFRIFKNLFESGVGHGFVFGMKWETGNFWNRKGRSLSDENQRQMNGQNRTTDAILHLESC